MSAILNTNENKPIKARIIPPLGDNGPDYSDDSPLEGKTSVSLLLGRSITILHVDDDECFLELAKVYLEDYLGSDLEIVSISDPRQVFLAFEKRSFDVIVSDYQMPEMTGLELLLKLRKQGISVPFIILTGKDPSALVKQSLDSMGFKHPHRCLLDTLGIDCTSTEQILNFFGIYHCFRKERELTSLFYELAIFLLSILETR
ncbi:MAG: response regulator [Candidatus Odinarchaeota archaeon]